MTELSDELLVAYVDGQLARKQSRAIEKVLDRDDVIARRVDALKDAHSRLEAAFEAILAGEEIVVSANSPPQRAGIWIEWRTIGAVLAAAGVGAALALIAAGYGWPLKMPELLRHSGTVPTTQQTAIVTDWQEEVA
jgi:anti-sigma factor RsiW